MTILQQLRPPPDLLKTMQDQIADLQARVEALKSENEDGRPPRVAGRWLRCKEAMRATGYSRSGLRKLEKQGRIRVDHEAPHPLYDVSSIVSKVRKVPA